ncbi:MAG: hypothetical protein WDA59_10925 [Methanofastidiosum sp.]
MFQCNSCVFLKDRECNNKNAEETWMELAETGECPGYYGKIDAKIDDMLRFSEKEK